MYIYTHTKYSFQKGTTAIILGVCKGWQQPATPKALRDSLCKTAGRLGEIRNLNCSNPWHDKI